LPLTPDGFLKLGHDHADRAGTIRGTLGSWTGRSLIMCEVGDDAK
jgi:hypothetical protein